MSSPAFDCSALWSLDLETTLIRSALQSPPPVVACIFDGATPDMPAQAFGLHQMERPLRTWLASGRPMVGQNIAYDFAVLLEWFPSLRPAIFALYDANLVFDTGLYQRILEISTGDMRGSLPLDRLCAAYGLHVEKPAERTDFGRFLGACAEEIPEAHMAYAKEDPRITWELFTRQVRRHPGLVLPADLARMCRADLALKITAAFGLRADPERTSDFRARAIEHLEALQAAALDLGFLAWERKGIVKKKFPTQLAVAEAYGLGALDDKGRPFEDPIDPPPGLLTDKGAVSCSAGVLAESGVAALMTFFDYGEWSSALNKDIKVFEWSAHTGLPFHTRYGFAATTRTTSSGGRKFDPATWAPGMNVQNYKKNPPGWRPGMKKERGARECIMSRLGGLVASDYTGLENGTLAQVIVNVLGRRGMADKISGRGTPDGKPWDFHCDVGAQILRCTYPEIQARIANGDKAAKLARSAAKPLNFGLPGFMTRPETVQSYAKIGYGVNETVERWKELIDVWYATQHDQVAYLRQYVMRLRTGNGLFNVPIPGTGIIRRGATRTAAANTPFQGLGAQVATIALYEVVRGQVLGQIPGRACAFVHDEIVSDAREIDLEDVRFHHERVMLGVTERLMPDVAMHVQTTAMAHWSKDANPAHDAAGRLILSEKAEKR